MNNNLLTSYDTALVEGGELSSQHFFGRTPSRANQGVALQFIRYALEDVLKWTPEEAVKKFDDYTINIMKLRKIVQYIIYPAGIEPGDAKYILSLLYPRFCSFDSSDIILKTYENVLNTGRQFPRGFFLGIPGFNNYCACFNYAVNQFHPVRSVSELYDFMDSPDGKRFLNDYRLKVPAEQFSFDIYNCIQAITTPENHGDFYYSFYSFKRALKKKMRKEKNRTSSQADKKDPD